MQLLARVAWDNKQAQRASTYPEHPCEVLLQCTATQAILLVQLRAGQKKRVLGVVQPAAGQSWAREWCWVGLCESKVMEGKELLGNSSWERGVRGSPAAPKSSAAGGQEVLQAYSSSSPAVVLIFPCWFCFVRDDNRWLISLSLPQTFNPFHCIFS